MPGRSDIQAGRAYVELFVKNSALVKGLNDAKKQLQGLGKSILSIGGFLTGLGASIVTPLIAAVGQFAAMGSELNDMSERTGLAAGNLAELGYAAKQGGSDLGTVEKALKFMAKSGKDVKDFDKVAAEIAAIEDPSKRSAAAMKAFGKAGPALLPMLADLQALREEARQMGVVPTEEAVKMADAIGDAWDSVKSVVEATIFNIGAALAPVLLPALNAVKNIAAWFNRWSKTNGEIIRSVFLIGGGLVAAGAAITAVGALIFGMGTAFGVVASAITTVAGILGGLMSPAALLVAAIVGGVYAWVRFTDSGKQAVATIQSIFMPMVDTIKTTLGGVGDALIAGDLELAANVAVTGLKLVFAQAVDAISSMIGGTLGKAFGDIGTKVIQGDLQGAWQTAIASMGKLWADFSAGVVGLMAKAMKGVMDLWQNTVSGIANGLLKMSAEGGIMGKIANLFVGADVAKIKADNDRMDRERMAKGMGGPQDIFSIGSGSIKDSTNAMRGPVDDFMKSMSQVAKDKADEAGNDLENNLGGGGGVSETVKRLQEQLDELLAQAAAAKEAANKTKKKGGGPDTSGLDEMKSDISTGFSAYGLLAQGGPGDRIARGIDKLVEIAAEQKRLTEQMVADEVEVEA